MSCTDSPAPSPPPGGGVGVTRWGSWSGSDWTGLGWAGLGYSIHVGSLGLPVSGGGEGIGGHAGEVGGEACSVVIHS